MQKCIANYIFFKKNIIKREKFIKQSRNLLGLLKLLLFKYLLDKSHGFTIYNFVYFFFIYQIREYLERNILLFTC